jgi:hypothetical protein
MNDDLKKYLDERLLEWSEWFSQDNSYGLGYASCSVEYRLMTEGSIINSTAPKLSIGNSRAEEIELLVNEMSQQNATMASALRIQYFGRKKSRERSDELQLSAARFKVYVEMARQWMIARLSLKRYPR